MSAFDNSELKDKKISLLVSFLVLLFVYFLLYINTIERSHDKIISITLETDIPLEPFQDFKEIKPISESSGGGGGGGTPSNDKIDPTPRPQTERTLTSRNSEDDAMPDKGNSNKTTAEKSNNAATSTKKSIDPFADGGNGDGSGGGIGKGKGIGFGPDDGPGKGIGFGPDSGPGKGNGSGKRIRLNDPNVDDIVSDANCKINLRVKIDEDGNVLSAINTSKTTTTNQAIINKVISATVNQVKYNKKSGASIEEQYISINLRAR